MSGSASIRPDEGREPSLPWSPWTTARWPSGWTVMHIDETGSTNDDLLAAAMAGDVPPRSALVTAHQTAGRGRLDRRWDAPPGSNLLVTLLPRADGASPAAVMQRVGLAIVEGLEQLAGAPVPGLGLKWPNDVLLGDRKMAGVLAQARMRPGTETGPDASVVPDGLVPDGLVPDGLVPDGLVMVVGFGLNVAWAPSGAACVHADVPDMHELDRATLLAAILTAFDRHGTDVGLRYRRRLVTLGQRVRITLPGDRSCEGRAIAVDEEGRLEVVDDGGASHRFDVGDVIHLRPGARPGSGDR